MTKISGNQMKPANLQDKNKLGPHGGYVIRLSGKRALAYLRKLLVQHFLLSCPTTTASWLPSPAPFLGSQQDLLQDIYTCYEASAKGTPIQVATLELNCLNVDNENYKQSMARGLGWKNKDNDSEHCCLPFPKNTLRISFFTGTLN